MRTEFASAAATGIANAASSLVSVAENCRAPAPSRTPSNTPRTLSPLTNGTAITRRPRSICLIVSFRVAAVRALFDSGSLGISGSLSSSRRQSSSKRKEAPPELLRATNGSKLNA